MKKQILCLVVLVFCGLMFAQEDTESLAVATFDVGGDAVSEGEADAITELFIAEMEATGRVNIVDRSNFEMIMGEIGFLETDWSKKERTTELGNAVYADMLCSGQISKMGSKYYLIATIIDIEDTFMLSSVWVSFTDIDEIDGILESFCAKLAKGLDATEVAEVAEVKIGDRGPGGGLIFHIEGNTYYECSDNLGRPDWDGAVALAENYRGGDYDDWYLPTKEELNYIYQNLCVAERITSNGVFWSSSASSTVSAWNQDFSSGNQDTTYGKNADTNGVRAVRAFNP